MSKKILITLFLSSVLFARIGLVTDGDVKTFFSMCKKGDMESCNDLSSIYEAKGKSQEAIKFYTKAIELYKKSCENKDLCICTLYDELTNE